MIEIVGAEGEINDVEEVIKKLSEFSPKYCFMAKIPVNYVPNAYCIKIFEFLNDVLHEEDIDCIQEWFGYQLYREYFIKKQLKQFVSAQILKEIQTDPEKMKPKKQKATILFTDIRGFSSLSERKDPEELATFLNLHYFTPLGGIVFKYNGTLDLSLIHI